MKSYMQIFIFLLMLISCEACSWAELIKNDGVVVNKWNNGVTLPKTAPAVIPGVKEGVDAVKAKTSQAVIPSQSSLAAGQDNAAKLSADNVETDDFKQRVKEYAKQLQGGEAFKDSQKVLNDIQREMSDSAAYPDMTTPWEKIKSKGQTLASDERIYIFISSSVPIETLRAYAESIDALGNDNIVMVMRGFIGGAHKAAPTFNWLSTILNKNSDCIARREQCDGYHASVIIDPNLFARYKPEVVPAIVYVKGVNITSADASEGLDEYSSYDPDKVWTIYGDLSLGYALELFNREVPSDSLVAMAKVLGR